MMGVLNMLNAEQNYEESLIDMKSIPIDKRPNIGVQDMAKYKNGGLTVESLEVNGALVYIPYGIYVHIFRAIDTGTLAIANGINELHKSNKRLLKNSNDKLSKAMIENNNYTIEKLTKTLDILRDIEPLVNEV